MSYPLHSLHERAGVDFQPYGDIPVVSTFGDPRSEYAAVRKSAAVMDCAHRGVLELTGRDRLAFLNNLLTNETWNKERKTGLAPGGGVYAFLLNVKGRLVADMNVLELGERTLLEMDARLVEPVRVTLDRYLFAEQVTMTSRTGELHELFVTGPLAREAVGSALGSALPALQYLQSARILLLGHEATVWRDDPSGVPGYFLLCPAAGAEAIWTRLTHSEAQDTSAEQFARFRGLARPFGWAVFNTTRIEAGRPIFGIDFDETVLPAETGQFNRGVSVTKGCYLGQEIVARMHARQQVARQLAGLKIDGGALPIAGAKVFDGQQNEIGGITSSTVSPVLSNAPIALGLLKRPYFAAGTKVLVPAEGSMRSATVVQLPFVPFAE